MRRRYARLRGEGSRRRSWKLTLLAAGVALPSLLGCGHSTQVNIVGAYFPVWLLAILVGVAMAFLARYTFVRLRIEPYVGPLGLIYACITVSVSCLVWLLFV